jgi:hypothetical protein
MESAAPPLPPPSVRPRLTPWASPSPASPPPPGLARPRGTPATAAAPLIRSFLDVRQSRPAPALATPALARDRPRRVRAALPGVDVGMGVGSPGAVLLPPLLAADEDGGGEAAEEGAAPSLAALAHELRDLDGEIAAVAASLGQRK